MCFKNKLDKALALYPDVPRCSESGHTYDRNFRKSNSLCDHYGDANIRRRIEKMDIAWLAVPQDGHAPVPGAKLNNNNNHIKTIKNLHKSYDFTDIPFYRSEQLEITWKKQVA